MAAPRTASSRRPPELRRPRLLLSLLPLLLLLPLPAPSRGELGLRTQAKGADPGTPRGPALGARAGETRRDSALRARGVTLARLPVVGRVVGRRTAGGAESRKRSRGVGSVGLGLSPGLDPDSGWRSLERGKA